MQQRLSLMQIFIKGNHRVLTKDGEIRTRFSDSRKEHAGKLLDYEFALKHIIGGIIFHAIFYISTHS